MIILAYIYPSLKFLDYFIYFLINIYVSNIIEQRLIDI